jgi:predicted transposase YbfD/YdcC
MARTPPLRIAHHSRDLPDPRLDHLSKHDFLDILTITICAASCGQQSWTDIELDGETHHDWLKTFWRLPHGIPSHDTFRGALSRLCPLAFQRCFGSWITALSQATDLRLIAIDGKALRDSLDRAHGKAALHLVSAWATENHLALGQVATDAKSNEITAIPRLLGLLDLAGALVTLDALGCPKEIAQKVRDGGADSLLAVKENQPRLLEDIQAAVAEQCDRAAREGAEGAAWFETVEVGHGRREVRTYTLRTDLTGLRDRELGADLHGVCVAVSARTVGGNTSTEIRYYSGSSHGSVHQGARAIRGHWGIENGLHWVLDVDFREDHSRARAAHGAENLAWLRRMAVSLLRNDTTCERSLRQKSIKALCDHEFLLQLLAQVNGEKE